jgi:hypothetical protein
MEKGFLENPPYAQSDINFAPIYKASCFCGNVAYEIAEEPLGNISANLVNNNRWNVLPLYKLPTTPWYQLLGTILLTYRCAFSVGKYL